MKAMKAIVAAIAMMSTIATATTPPMMATVLELSRVGGRVVTNTSPFGPTGAAKKES